MLRNLRTACGGGRLEHVLGTVGAVGDAIDQGRSHDRAPRILGLLSMERAATDLEKVLKRYRARLDDAGRRRRLSCDPSDYTEVLGVLEEMIDACVDTALERLGDRRRRDESTGGAIRRVADVVARHPAELSGDAPVRFLSGKVHDLDKRCETSTTCAGASAGAADALPT
ncbi:MAG TPA: hypothetical protein VHJ34_06675 [Actinomycetota bacterium]|nr:hypothetical protein [Actinomycetota bacterium]